MESRRVDALTSLGLLVLRLGIGGYMATHGWSKLQMLLKMWEGQAPMMGDPIGLGEKATVYWSCSRSSWRRSS